VDFGRLSVEDELTNTSQTIFFTKNIHADIHPKYSAKLFEIDLFWFIILLQNVCKSKLWIYFGCFYFMVTRMSSWSADLINGCNTINVFVFFSLFSSFSIGIFISIWFECIRLFDHVISSVLQYWSWGKEEKILVQGSILQSTEKRVGEEVSNSKVHNEAGSTATSSHFGPYRCSGRINCFI